MHLQRDAVSGNKDAVSLKEVQHKVFTEKHTAAVCTEQDMEAVGARAVIGERAETLGIKKKTFHLKIPAAGEKLGGAARTVTQETHRLAGFGRGGKLCDRKRFINMQGAGLTVFIRTVVIIEAIGQVAVLLNFGKQDTSSDFMNCACGNIEKVIRLNGNMVEV